MYRKGWMLLAAAGLILATGITLSAADQDLPAGFTSLFNGKDLSGWKVPEEDNGHWKVINGVIDYDAPKTRTNKADKTSPKANPQLESRGA